MDSRADQCIREQEQLASNRGIFEGHWREVAERVRPTQNMFQMQQRPMGGKRNEKVFDSTAPLALPKFAAAVISMTMPATQKYQAITVDDEQLEEDAEVSRYLEGMRDLIFKVRYSPRAEFQSQTGEVMLDVGAFGTSPLFIDDDVGNSIQYKSFPLAECFFGEDHRGRIDTNHRRFQWTAHQAASKFGVDRLPEKIKQAYEKEPHGPRFWFLHCVRPNPEIKARAKDYRGMPFWSCYIAQEERHIIDEGGFRVFPYAVTRYETAPREVYGRSPAMAVLPSIKSLNEMKKTKLRAAHLVVSPPIMLSDDGSLQAFNLRPNALNYGAIDDQGRPRAMPFNSGAKIDIAREEMQDEREAINDAFFVTLFRILVEEPQITATEAMLRAQEKGQLLGPPMGRVQSGLLGPCTEREIDILHHAGVFERQLGPMPDKLREHFYMGGEYHVRYEAPLNLAQQAGAGVGIMQTIQAIAPLAQLTPEVMLIFDPVKAARELARINGVPNKVLRSEKEVDDLKAQQDQAQQAQQLLAAAPVAAGAAKDMAQAASLAASVPNQQAGQVVPA
jgi:hypothetical protein